LNELHKLILENLALHCDLPIAKLNHRDFRTDDFRNSLADISKAQALLSYSPTLKIVAVISEEMPWYLDKAESL
jgi:UDP-N-acetylglucosamine 4-epimerase